MLDRIPTPSPRANPLDVPDGESRNRMGFVWPVWATGIVVACVVLFGAHALLFFGWMIDDAGISFAYARNLAHGAGLTIQPGIAPVEGFSNPLWTLMVSAFYSLHLFYEPWTPKLVSFALVIGVFLQIG